MKPLISYYGGKQRLANKILPLLPAHMVYVEPFCGGAALLFSKPAPPNSRHYREVINDTDELLINLYQVAREQPEEFQYLVNWTPHSQAEFRQAIAICKNPSDYSKLEKAWAYYTNICNAFANKLNGGWGTSLVSQHQADKWNNKKARLPETLERLQRVTIACEDALRCIDRWDSAHTCFYIDPPYPDTNQGHYSGYTQENFKALLEKLETIQGSFVLSCYPNADVPKEWERFEFQATCSASGKGKTGNNRDRSAVIDSADLGDRTRTEVVWRCDRSSGVKRADVRRNLHVFQELAA